MAGNIGNTLSIKIKMDFLIIDAEIKNILGSWVISKCPIKPRDYFSHLFSTPKKDGTFHTILNMKYLNQECGTYHIKMESLRQAVHEVKSNCHLSSIDIKDAFYSANSQTCKKYLKFLWLCKSHQYVMPNGCVDAMRVFTNILKLVFAHLKEQGLHVSSVCKLFTHNLTQAMQGKTYLLPSEAYKNLGLLFTQLNLFCTVLNK